MSSPDLNPVTTEEDSGATIAGKHSPTKAYWKTIPEILEIWNASFTFMFAFAVSVDPLFLYTPMINEDIKCITLDKNLTKTALALRFFMDLYYIQDIFLQIIALRVGVTYDEAHFDLGIRRYIPVKQIVKKIWRSYIPINVLAVFPVPQVAILVFFAKMKGTRSIRMFLNFLVVLQYVPRVLHIYQLFKKLEKSTPKRKNGIIRVTGVFTFWIRGAFIFFLFILASHVFGALWYFFSFQREIDCWQYACRSENGCELGSLSCKDNHTFRNVTLLSNLCPINPPINATFFDFGIFLDAVQSGMISSTDFPQKFLHCFWWGLRNLSSFGQNLQTSIYAWENLFAVFICIIGMLLVLIYLNAVLQMYFQLTTARSKENRKLAEMREKRNPQIASWLDENDLPFGLKEKIMTCVLDELNADEDLNIKNIHSVLPCMYLVEIKSHLCFNSLKKVSVLQNVNEIEFKAFCEYLTPVIYEEDSFIIREGELYDKMLFITQGTVRTYTSSSITDGCLQKGDYHGEQLVEAWVSNNLLFTISNKNLRCSTKVEAFTLTVEDMKRSLEKIQAELSQHP